MVVAALARGYEYYAITDHSHYLRDGRLAAQLEEIEQMRERYPKLRILAGVEANIRSNGEVDVPEEELARLDWVVASVHNAPENRPTERVLEAMQNPYVDCIGHLTGRRIGTRGPRDVDVERVIEGALEAGCFLEINGQPDRLDLRDVHARAAKEAGLKLAVTLRRPPDEGAELRRARDRPGAARLADEGRRRRTRGRGRSSPSCAEAPVTFRDDGYAAVDWAADYLDRLGELPVLAQVEPGELTARLPDVRAGAGRAVRERAARPRRADRPRAHELAAPALLRVLRRHGV